MAKPRPQTTWQWIFLYLKGMCMGVADIVPGISGGTIAFIMGFYGDLLESLCTFSRQSFKDLFSGRLTKFSKTVAWEFLLALVLGIATSLIVFAKLLTHLLNDPEQRIILYSSFFGLILASVIVCARQVRQWSCLTVAAFTFSILAAWQITSLSGAPWTLYTPQMFDPWLILCGALAVCALLLPGISGSYVLTILGIYIPVIMAISELTTGLSQGVWEQTAFLILANIGIGIVLGGVLFSHLIRWLLSHYHNLTIAVMTGFMLGAVRTIWPFWSSVYMLHPFHADRGLQLLVLDPYLPSLSSAQWWVAIPCAVAGFVLVFIIEGLANRKPHAKTVHAPVL